MITFTRQNNVDAVLIRLLKKLKINVSSDVAIAELEKHPDYPSLLSISDVLNNFQIENSAFRLQADELSNIPTPFIAHTSFGDDDFVLVEKIENGNVLFSNEKGNRQKATFSAFKQLFDGVILTAQPAVGETPFRSAEPLLSRLRVPLVAASLLLVFMIAVTLHKSYFLNYTWQLLLLSIIKTAGLATSILLLIQSIDSNNPLIQKLCQGSGKTNCNAILSSKAAKVQIANVVAFTWSEVGFFYFAGTWLILFFGNHSTPIMQTLSVLNIISLPYTFYSIYYQARLAKQWCLLCCIVQVLLWLEFIPLVTFFRKSFGFPTISEWCALFIALALPVILWAILRPLLLKLQQLAPLKQQLRKFKYNQKIFDQLQLEQPKYLQPDDGWSIVLGNVEANHCITMVTNPYCPPCSKIHKLLDELLDQHRNIQARIVFTANNTDDDIKTAVSRHLMALNELENKAMVKQALSDWYAQKQKDYKSWAKVYPVELNVANYHKLDQQKAWCKMAEVTATPTLLLNGYRLPDLYQLPDLKYMLE